MSSDSLLPFLVMSKMCPVTSKLRASVSEIHLLKICSKISTYLKREE